MPCTARCLIASCIQTNFVTVVLSSPYLRHHSIQVIALPQSLQYLDHGGAWIIAFPGSLKDVGHYNCSTVHVKGTYS